MRSRHVAVALVVSLPGLTLLGACSPDPEPIAGAPDSDELLAEDASPYESWESTEPETGFRLALCVLMKNAQPLARATFCVSQPETDVRARCYAHTHDSAVSWANWCYNEFGE